MNIHRRPDETARQRIALLETGKFAGCKFQGATIDYLRGRGVRFIAESNVDYELQEVQYPLGWTVTTHHVTTNYTYMAIKDAAGKLMATICVDNYDGLCYTDIPKGH